MHALTVRFGPKAYQRVVAAAAAEGVTVSRYIRVAVLTRAALQDYDRGEPVQTAFKDIIDEVLELARERGETDGH